MAKVFTKENIVIVGGGLAGINIARLLSAKLDHSKYDLIVVEPRPYLVYMIGGARMAVTTEQGAMDKYLLRYKKFFAEGKGTVKTAKVESIVPNQQGGVLHLVGGETLSYLCASSSTAAVAYVNTISCRPCVGDWVQVDWSPRIPRRQRRRHSPVRVPVATKVQIREGYCYRWRRRCWLWYVGHLLPLYLPPHSRNTIELAGELRDEYPVSTLMRTLLSGDVKLTCEYRTRRSPSFKATICCSTRPTQMGSGSIRRPRWVHERSSSFWVNTLNSSRPLILENWSSSLAKRSMLTSS
jgi:hypothetical protein